MLTEQQKHEFETFGFLLLKDFIPPDEMQLYIDVFDETMTKANGGVPWQRAPQNHTVMPFYRHNPAVYHRLLDDEKISEVVEDLLGEDFIFWVTEGHHRYGGTEWHYDSAPEDMTHLKVVFPLEPVRADTGCLSMLPGTHFPPMRERMERWYGGPGLGDRADYAAWPAAIALESDPGDAVIFNVNVYHAAIGERHDRRCITVNYFQKPSKPEHEEHLKFHYVHSQSHNPFYTPELFEDATPRRMRMLSFLKEACYDAREAAGQ